jgi:serine protease Do
MKFSQNKVWRIIALSSIVLFLGMSLFTDELRIIDNSSNEIGFCVNVPTENPEEKRVKAIQQQITKIYDKLLQSTVRIEVRNSAASAVMVSEDGYILTAAHVIEAVGGSYANIRLHDGSTYRAKCLGMDKKGDYGLMKIEPKGKLVFSEMGTASTLAKDEACLMLGHPASKEEERPAIGRIGFYKGINENDYLKTTCIMMPGDSGGPLFNLEGQVVGICSYINRGIEENYYPSVDNIKKNWDKLIKGENLNPDSHMGFGSSTKEAVSKNKPFVLKGGKSTLNKILSAKSFKVKKAVVSIQSLDNDETKSTLGTIISKDGYVIAKSSQVNSSEITVTLYDDTQQTAKIISRDKTNDIVLLKTKASKKLTPLNLELASQVKVGELLGVVTDGDDINLSGVLGLASRKIEGSSRSFLGVQFAQQEGAVVDYVLEESAAEKYGIQAQDEIIKFNASKVSKRQDLLEALSKTKPNQEVKITVLRNNQEKQVAVVLGKRSSRSHHHHPADYVEVNDRNDDFPYAFTHDMPLQKNQCGSPVINLKGEVIGINIARKNRTSSLAIPLDYLNNVVKRLLEDADNNS